MIAGYVAMSTSFMPSVKPTVKNFNYVGDIKPTSGKQELFENILFNYVR